MLLKIEGQNKILIHHIRKEADALGLVLTLEEWRSKYNTYVIYEYEPFCSDGFMVELHYSGKEETKLYMQAIANSLINAVKLLETCATLPDAKKIPQTNR